MIQIRMMKTNDIRPVNQMLKECTKTFDDLNLEEQHCFVVEDGNRICGLAGYHQTETDKAELTFLFVKSEDRGFKLGDGLLRAILNHLDHKKVTQVYITSIEKTDGFFIAEGLEVTMKMGERLIFRAELPEFFNTPCKGSRGNA